MKGWLLGLLLAVHLTAAGSAAPERVLLMHRGRAEQQQAAGLTTKPLGICPTSSCGQTITYTKEAQAY
jgi:hypothetical protein